MKKVLLSTYVYEGPVYRFGNYVKDYKLETEAPTKGRAKSNILYRIKQDMGLDRTAKIEIIDSRILEILDETREEIRDNIRDNMPEQLSLFDECDY